MQPFLVRLANLSWGFAYLETSVLGTMAYVDKFINAYLLDDVPIRLYMHAKKHIGMYMISLYVPRITGEFGFLCVD